MERGLHELRVSEGPKEHRNEILASTARVFAVGLYTSANGVNHEFKLNQGTGNSPRSRRPTPCT